MRVKHAQAPQGTWLPEGASAALPARPHAHSPVQLAAEGAPAAGVVRLAGQGVQPLGPGLVVLPAGDQEPRGQAPHMLGA